MDEEVKGPIEIQIKESRERDETEMGVSYFFLALKDGGRNTIF